MEINNGNEKKTRVYDWEISFGQNQLLGKVEGGQISSAANQHSPIHVDKCFSLQQGLQWFLYVWSDFKHFLEKIIWNVN